MKGNWFPRKTLPVAGFALLTAGLSDALSPSAVRGVVSTAYAATAPTGASINDATALQDTPDVSGRSAPTPGDRAAVLDRGSRALSSLLIPVGLPRAVEKALGAKPAAVASGSGDLSGLAPDDSGQDASRQAVGFDIAGPLSSAPTSRLMQQYGITSQSPSEVRASGEALALAPSADAPRRSR